MTARFEVGPTLSVSELFGPTIQGEGPTQGRATMFLRLGLCNLDCSWCDTPYTWDWIGKNGTKYDRTAELVTMPVTDIVSQLKSESGPVRRVVITGGEPLVQKRSLSVLVTALVAEGYEVEVETNGTLAAPPELLDAVQLNVSPKLSNSGIDADRRIDLEVLRELVDYGATLKFVVASAVDIIEVRSIVRATSIDPRNVYLMPEGIDANEIMAKLGQTMLMAAEHGYNVSPRLHVLAHGNRRGV